MRLHRSSTLSILLLACFVWTGAACSAIEGRPEDPEGRLAISVSALSLPGIDAVIYNLTLTAGAETVWRKMGLSSAQYGAGPNLSYIGPCDATVPQNMVIVEIAALRSGGEDVDRTTWRDPGPISVLADCRPNADTRVDVNIAIMRNANQGFFDVAVNFDDIFCAAKLDCGTESGPIRLVHNPEPEGPSRLRSAVVGLSCTSGKVGVGTTLYLNELHVVCDEATWVFDPAWPVGNGPGAGFVARTMRFRDETNLGGGITGCTWNQALGFVEGTLGRNCRIETAGTAGHRFVGARTPPRTVYPKIVYSVPLTDASGQLVCRDHPLDGIQSNGQPSGVYTTYTAIGGEAFDRAWSCSEDAEPATPGRVACGPTVLALGEATVTEGSRGIVVSADGVESEPHRLPAAYGGLGPTAAARLAANSPRGRPSSSSSDGSDRARRGMRSAPGRGAAALAPASTQRGSWGRVGVKCCWTRRGGAAIASSCGGSRSTPHAPPPRFSSGRCKRW